MSVRRGRPFLAAAGCALLLLRAAPGLPFGARVQIDLPAAVEARGLAAGKSLSPAPIWVGYRHALLPPGQRLRLSVRAEGLGERSGVAAVSFTTSHPRGGVGLRGRLAGPEFVPVFEGHPLAVSGGVEVVWAVETSGPARHAGRNDLVLRWRVESVAGPEGAGVPPSLPSPAAGSPARSGAAELPAVPTPSRPDRSRSFPHPGLGGQGPP